MRLVWGVPESPNLLPARTRSDRVRAAGCSFFQVSHSDPDGESAATVPGRLVLPPTTADAATSIDLSLGAQSSLHTPHSGMGPHRESLRFLRLLSREAPTEGAASAGAPDPSAARSPPPPWAVEPVEASPYSTQNNPACATPIQSLLSRAMSMPSPHSPRSVKTNVSSPCNPSAPAIGPASPSSGGPRSFASPGRPLRILSHCPEPEGAPRRSFTPFQVHPDTPRADHTARPGADWRRQLLPIFLRRPSAVAFSGPAPFADVPPP
jgi:hypothetical protein